MWFERRDCTSFLVSRLRKQDIQIAKNKSADIIEPSRQDYCNNETVINYQVILFLYDDYLEESKTMESIARDILAMAETRDNGETSPIKFG